jgi:hypothetical protein
MLLLWAGRASQQDQPKRHREKSELFGCVAYLHMSPRYLILPAKVPLSGRCYLALKISTTRLFPAGTLSSTSIDLTLPLEMEMINAHCSYFY